MKIKQFTIENIYQDIATYSMAIQSLEFTPQSGGEENTEYSELNEHVVGMMNSFSPFLELSTRSGAFRKPYNTIRFEDFFEKTAFVGYLAMEPTEIKFFQYIGDEPLKEGSKGSSVYDIDFEVKVLVDEYIHEEKWECTETISLKPNELFFFEPHRFHKINSDLVQMFYLDFKTQPQQASSEG